MKADFWSHRHPFQVIRDRESAQHQEKSCCRWGVLRGINWPSVSAPESPLCRAEEKGPDGGRGRPGQGRPHAETPSLLLTNTAVDNLSLGGSAPHRGAQGGAYVRRTCEDGNTGALLFLPPMAFKYPNVHLPGSYLVRKKKKKAPRSHFLQTLYFLTPLTFKKKETK